MSRGLRIGRWVLLVLAVALIIAGVADGGYTQVLLKAKKICLECMGIGG